MQGAQPCGERNSHLLQLTGDTNRGEDVEVPQGKGGTFKPHPSTEDDNPGSGEGDQLSGQGLLQLGLSGQRTI